MKKKVKKTKKNVKKVAKKKVVKKVVKKTVKKAVKKNKKVVNKPLGVVTHYYNHIGVAIVKFNEPVSQGKILHFKGATTDFVQPADSMQFDHQVIAVAKKGQEVGLKVKDRVREGDEIYLANQ